MDDGLAYYNEIDRDTAAWLRVLIAAGHIADGVVDERSIEDVRPSDLRGFRQHHFFAGIGVWSYALRRAGWRDDRPVWTGSCPCQPFSAAGKGAGFADERHLWPAFYHLIEEHRAWCIQTKRPIPTIFGEQVASAPVDDWVDLVHADLEALGYAFGSVPFPSAGVGAPHIRDRNYWVAHAVGGRRSEPRKGESLALQGNRTKRSGQSQRSIANGVIPRRSEGLDGSAAGRLAYSNGAGRGARSKGFTALGYRTATEPDCGTIGLADNPGDGRGEQRQDAAGSHQRSEAQELEQRPGRSGVFDDPSGGPGPTNGFWSDADWLGCRDGKWRPVEPGTFPLADGAAARVVRLRGYGNAVNAEAAQAWIETVMECLR